MNELIIIHYKPYNENVNNLDFISDQTVSSSAA